jgi:hypothetical protein
LDFQNRNWNIFGFWLGATTVGQDGSFVWQSNYTAPTYTNWAPNQPDNTQSPRCLAIALNSLQSFEGKWMVQPCEKGYTDQAMDTVCELTYSCT